MKKSVPIPNLTATATPPTKISTGNTRNGERTEGRDEEAEEPDEEEESMVFLWFEIDLLGNPTWDWHC